MKAYSDLRKFMDHPINFLDAHQDRPLSRVKLGPKTFFLVFDPMIAREILVSRSAEFIQNRTIFDRIKPVTGARGLVQLSGAESREARKQIRPLMTAPGNKDQIDAIAREYIGSLQEGELDVSAFMSDLILTTAFQLFLGIRTNTKPIAKTFLELNRLCGKRMTSLIAFPDPRIFFLARRLRKMIPGDDHSLTLLFAGHETTASSIVFTLLMLAHDPEAQARVAGGDLDFTLQYYKESLRIYPPAYMLVREAALSTELEGLKVKKGDQIVIGLLQMQRQNAPGSFMPMGLGPKSCIGEPLAYLEAVTVLTRFCASFEFTRETKAIGIRPFITLNPAPGQSLSIRRRQ